MKKSYKQNLRSGRSRSIRRDRSLSAKKIGYRRSASGRKYFENRQNRSDHRRSRV